MARAHLTLLYLTRYFTDNHLDFGEIEIETRVQVWDNVWDNNLGNSSGNTLFRILPNQLPTSVSITYGNAGEGGMFSISFIK